MTSSLELRSCQRLLHIQTATVIIGTLSIVGGLLSSYLLFTDLVPLYYRVFYLVNGILMSLFGVLVIYGVAEDKPKYLEPFLVYQMITLIFSSIAIVFTLFDEPEVNAFVVNMHLRGRRLKPAASEEIESSLVVVVFAFSLLLFFVLPTLYMFVVLRCYIHLKDKPKNLNSVVYQT